MVARPPEVIAGGPQIWRWNKGAHAHYAPKSLSLCSCLPPAWGQPSQPAGPALGLSAGLPHPLPSRIHPLEVICLFFPSLVCSFLTNVYYPPAVCQTLC